eukprot:Phypoly_transcript_14854.p1 GENE.Phypoly_transcript_14854~~Phypoly_transcript_14854.p1  ORF type:complete len:268 (+),score=24.58 Phypoly_transcript_14854:105-908(+)
MFGLLCFALLHLSVASAVQGCVFQIAVADNGIDILAVNSTSNCEGATFPPTLLTKANTQHLQVINLPNCKLSGKIFSYINSTVLTYINIQGNYFNDTIPSWFGHMTTLQVFNIANNKFHGTIPYFGRLYSLTVFDIANNSLSGQFQSVLPFAALTDYSIAGNQFYLDTSNTSFQFVGQPPYIANTGIESDGIKQIDCITILKGAGTKIPSWCAHIDSTGRSRCTCEPKCGNGILEEGEVCEISGPNATSCCSPNCKSLEAGSCTTSQ